jgi:hypothetical protein
MRRAFLLTIGVLAAATPALGQGSPRSDDRDSYSERRDGGGRGSWREDRHWGRGMEDDNQSSGSKRGARFMVRSGDARVAVRCDQSESMRACVDATLTLFERVRSGGSATSPSTGSNPASAPR